MNKTFLFLIVAVTSLLLTGEPTFSQDESPKEFHRKIFVPLESLDILLDGNSNRVLLSRAEYDELLASARTREIERAPVDSAIVSAKYTGEVSEGVAFIKGELIVESLNDGLVQIPLRLTGVAIRSASLGDEPAKLWRNRNGQIVLLTSNKSRQTLSIEMTVPVQTSAARQSISLQFPSPSATNFNLNVPGNVEVKSGVSVASRIYDENTDTTQFDLLATRAPMNIVMSLNNRLLKDEQVTVSRSVLIHKLTPHTQEMHVTCSMNVIHGAVEKAEFTVPEGFSVSHVSTELLSQWEITDPPENTDEPGKRLVVKLRQPTREDFVLNIIAARNTSAVGQWDAEDIRPIDVAGHVSVVGVLADIELESAKLVSDGVIPIDHAFLLAAIPESVKSNGRENPTSVVAAFYAPQKDYSISSSFSVPESELIVKSSSRLVIGDQLLTLQGGLSLISRHDSRFGFKMKLPNSWRLNELTGIDGKAIRFDRVGAQGSSEFLVHLPTRIPTNSATKLFFRASLTPDGWLEKWESNQVEFPSVVIEGESKHTGAIAISTSEDLTIKPANIAKLELLDETDKQKFELNRDNAPLAYQFTESDYRLSLELERLKPSIMARTYNYARIKPTQMSVHAELVYDIKQAGESEFKFELPLESPKSISIRSTQDSLKDYRSEDTDSARQWTVQLAKPRKGKVHLLVDFQMPLEESELAEIKLAPVLINDVSFQSSMFAVEGSSELDIEIESDGRAVDVGEFSEAIYQPGRYLLGAYSWPNENLSLTAKCVRRPIYQLPSAIVQRAEMVTSISNNGKAQTAARFQLVTKQQPFLRVELPEDATLWSVQLDGQPAKPQLLDGALLVSLIGNETGKLRDLQLVFESPAQSFTLVGKIQTQSPSLWLSETGDTKGLPVPLVDLHWRLIMPDGFSVSHSDGNFQSNQLVARPTPIQQLGDWIYRIGGGIDRSNRYAMSRQRAIFGLQTAMDESASMNDRAFYDAVPAFELDESEVAPQRNARPQTMRPLEPGIASKPRASKPRAESIFGGVQQGQGQGEGQGQGQGQGGGGAGGGGGGFAGQDNDQQKQTLWALSGLRSLNIQLTDTGNAIEFFNLGEQPTLTATVVDQSRLNWIAIAFAFLIAALGVLLTNRKLKSKVLFVMVVLVLACLLPLAGASLDAFRTIVDLVILAAVFVAIYFVVAGTIKVLGRSLTLVAQQIPLFLLLIAFSTGFANHANAQEVVSDAAELKRLIVELQSDRNVKLPSDAVIIPFDAEDPKGREKADRLLLPYEHYLSLINKADAGKQPKSIDAPIDFVLSSADYNLQLTLDDDISIEGKLVIDLMTDDPVSVALPLMGGALTDAKVDGTPAKLQFKSIENKKRNRSSNSSIVQLHLEGRGTKTLEFTVQIRPDRQGGWRMLDARLPVGLTRGLNIRSLPQPTEVRLKSDSDRRAIEADANQDIATTLSANGSLRLQWKPSTATQAVDQSLTAKSEAIFDVREDGLRLTWRVDLDFRGSERDVFTLNLPDGFLVEQVRGENVRAWDVKKDGDASRLNITTLSAAKDKETFTIELSQRDFAVGDADIEFDAPVLSVEGAALHKGVYSVRKSPIIELKTTKQQAASRIDRSQVKCLIDVGVIDAKSSPLGIEPFQVLQFVTTPFRIGLQAKLVPRTMKAETQSVLRVGQSEANLEVKVKVAVGKRPIYDLSFDMPKDVEIRSLTAGLNETWTSETLDDTQRVQLFFPTGVAGDFSIILDAELTEYSGQPEWTIPRVKINDVQQQDGYIAIQVDSALSVSTSNLNNCESVLLQQIESWLNRDQRSQTRLALRTKGAQYDATLRFTKIEPRVTVETVTNVRTTLFAIEETILLDFDIQQAGIRQIQFELPASMRNARINAKLVSETIVSEVTDNPDVVQVTLNLQDDVIDSFRVVVENDRQLSSARQNVPVPRVLTGITQQRFATLQNAGRDEISVLPSENFQSLNRQLKQFGQLKKKLNGGEVTMAYVAAAEAEQPVLQYETTQRDVFDTVAASIEFSKTTMVVDSSGAYRAVQTFQVNNRSEQYLEIELPTGAKLLTVLVEGQPVKPVVWPAAAKNERRLRIPLVKTQLGDLDYPVQLKFAGQLGRLSNLAEIEFPVIETLNINVQLSQLHLRLPSSHRWMNFGGTMTKVDSRGKLEESYLSYKSRQIQQLAQQIQVESSQFGSFSKQRAYGNLKKLKSDMDAYQTANPEISQRNGKQVLDLLNLNNNAIEQAEESFRQQRSQQGQIAVDNRANFNELIEGQGARRSRNSVTRSNQNFSSESLMLTMKDRLKGDVAGRNKGEQAFDGKWLERNSLQGVQMPGKSGETNPFDESPAQAKAQAAIVIANENAQVDDSISFFNPNDRSGPGSGKAQIGQFAQQADSNGMGGMGMNGMDGMGMEGMGGMGMGMNGMGGMVDMDMDGMDGDSGLDNDFADGRVQGQGIGRGPALPSDGKKSGVLGSSLSSLDIELPERGVDFYFKSPRGKAAVIAMPLETQSFSRWMSVAITLGVCIVAAIACWFLTWLCKKRVLRVVSTLGLLLAGLISLGSGFLPVYGLIAVIVSIVLLVDWTAHSVCDNATTSHAGQ